MCVRVGVLAKHIRGLCQGAAIGSRIEQSLFLDCGHGRRMCSFLGQK